MTATIKLVDGFINLPSRDWSRRGDKGSWLRFDAKTGKLTVFRSKGIMSDAYEAELAAFCAAYGIDFPALRSGEKASVIVESDVVPEPKGINLEQAFNLNVKSCEEMHALVQSLLGSTVTVETKELMARMSCAVMWLADELDKRTGTPSNKWIEMAHKAFPGMPTAAK